MRRKIRAVLLIAVLLTAMLIPTGFTMADGTEPVIPDAETVTEAADEKAEELFGEQPVCEYSELDTPAQEKSAVEPDQESINDPAEQTDGETIAEPLAEAFEEESIPRPEEVQAEIDYTKDAGENEAFTSGYAKVLSTGAEVFDSVSYDCVRTDRIASGIVYVLERASGSRDALRIVYLQAEGLEPATGWVSPKQVRPMDPDTEVTAYLEGAGTDAKAVRYMSSMLLTPVECGYAEDTEMTAQPEEETIGNETEATVQPEEETNGNETEPIVQPEEEMTEDVTEPTVQPEIETTGNETEATAQPEEETIGNETEATVQPEVETTGNLKEPVKARVTADNVNLRTAPGTEDTGIITRCSTGTKIIVLDSVEMSDGIWLQVRTKENAGWLRSDFTDFVPPANEPAEDASAEKNAEESTPGEPVEYSDYEAEILAWAAQTGATEEMIRRARNAKSLDSLVLEGEELIYVRTGEVMAIYDAGTGILFDTNSAMPVARLDIYSGMLYPLDNEG